MENETYTSPESAKTGTEVVNPKREYTTAEQLLLAIALVIGILFDRLFYARVLNENNESIPVFWGIFWLIYLVLFTVFYWKRLKSDKLLWFISACSAALCAWGLFFNSVNNVNSEYAALTFLVIPAVLMAHAVISAGEYKLKDAGNITVAWFSGWFIKPFTGLPTFFGILGSLASGGKQSVAKTIAIGIGISLSLLCVLIPLLSGADKVFGYYLGRIAVDWNLPSFVGHTIVIVIAFGLFYSFLWNIGYGKKNKTLTQITFTFDNIICGIVLGTVTLLYLLFCGIQFTYLFAGAGLPGGMTYSEYAREGFAQTVAVCAINLAIFGIFLRFGTQSRLTKVLLCGLLGLTGVMLVSGFVRLGLYIEMYGLTWLRMISGWFIFYLAAVIILCAVRLLREKLPVIALCAMLLLGWYVVLGYSNPNTFVENYNQSHGYTVSIQKTP